MSTENTMTAEQPAPAAVRSSDGLGRDVDPELTNKNPDLAGYDIESMAGTGAHYDGSGGGIRELAYQLKRLRETEERINLLRAFVRKHSMLLARLSWEADVDTLPPVKRDLFVPEIRLCGYTYNKTKATAQEIAALWPDAKWSRSIPRYSIEEDRVRDYTAEIDGVTVRITGAERLPAPVKIDRFPPCGPVRIKPTAKRPNDEADTRRKNL